MPGSVPWKAATCGGAAKTSAFFSIGGGAGWTNSSGGTDGLGPDLTLNWFTQLGLRHEITPGVSL